MLHLLYVISSCATARRHSRAAVSVRGRPSRCHASVTFETAEQTCGRMKGGGGGGLKKMGKKGQDMVRKVVQEMEWLRTSTAEEECFTDGAAVSVKVSVCTQRSTTIFKLRDISLKKRAVVVSKTDTRERSGGRRNSTCARIRAWRMPEWSESLRSSFSGGSRHAISCKRSKRELVILVVELVAIANAVDQDMAIGAI